MKKAADFLYSLGENLIKYLFLLVTGILAVGALFLTEMSDNMDTQNMILSVDKMYFTIPLTILMAAGGFGISVLIKKNAKKLMPIMFAVVCVWYFVLGAILILRARTMPSADALTCYYMADAVSRGNLGIIDPVNSYMTYYPQQIGLTSFLAVFMWIMHSLALPIAEYHFLKLLYLAMICIATFAQYRIVRKMWNSDTADCIFLFINAINLPYILYATYIYSEIPSYCFFSIGAWLLVELINTYSKQERLDGTGNCGKTRTVDSAVCSDDSITEGSAKCSTEGNDTNSYNRKSGIKALILAVLSILAFTNAVFLRKNILVLIIAVVIVTLFQLFKSKRPEWIAYSILCVACCVTILPIVIGCYEHAAGAKLTEGVTAKSYFAMGMQEGGRGPGWYNGFNFNTYVESGLNPEIANEISAQAISERVDYFKANPGYMFKFYARKFSTQWYDGTYASLQATYSTISDRSEFFNELYEGKYTGAFVIYCNALQNLVYIGAFLAIFSIWRNKEKNIFWKYLLAIGVFGGLLFHIIWEANSRYIVTYSFLLIPYAALGWANVASWVDKKVAASGNKKNNAASGNN